jgi:SOS-response transcriptional repressor LexA
MDGREWAIVAHDALVHGNAIQVRPRGDSMRPRIYDGDLVTLEPCRHEELAVGDIVLARVRGWLLVLHQIIEREPDRFLIGTTVGRVDGWVAAAEVFGRVVQVQSGI